jgi:hypothetical protein
MIRSQFQILQRIRGLLFNFSLDHKTDVTITSGTFSPPRTMPLWSRDGKLLKTLPAHSNQPTEVRCSPDGTPITPIKTGDTFNAAFNFTPNGDRLLSSSSSDINSWNLNLDDLLNQGCTWLGDYLRSHPQELAQLSSCRS